MCKKDDELAAQPFPRPSLLALLATLEPIAEEFPEVPDTELDPVEL